MKFKEVYKNFNDYYYQKLHGIIERANKFSDSADDELLRDLNRAGVDLDKVLYERLVDDYEEAEINSKRYGLLPLGIRNKNVPKCFITKKEIPENENVKITGNTFRTMLLNKPDFGPIYYHSKDSLRQIFGRICDSYIEHYKSSLDEVWSVEDFYARLSDLKYLSVKYAQDLETGEIFAIGFFGALVKNGAGGRALTDAELYVIPEFRKMGIAKRMVSLTFELAKNDGIEGFDSVTYRVQSCDALSFWQKVGASVTGLTHIEGNISEIIETIDKSSKMDRSF